MKIHFLVTKNRVTPTNRQVKEHFFVTPKDLKKLSEDKETREGLLNSLNTDLIILTPINRGV